MLKIDLIHQHPAAIIAIEGEVDLYSSPQVRDTLMGLTELQHPAIVLNLEKVTYMDSSGLATLIECLQATGKYSGKFILTHMRQEVREVFQLSQLDKVFTIFETLEEGLKNI